MGWEKVKLGDVLHRKTNRTKLSLEEEYKLVTIRLHHKGVVLRKNAKGKTIKSNMSLVQAGDFVLSGIDARNGAFGIVPDELDGAIITNDFWCIEPDETKMKKEFLLFLTSTKYFDYICNQSSDGTTQRIRLQKDKFYNYEIGLPPLEEQERVLIQLRQKTKLSEKIGNEQSHQLTLLKKLRLQILQDAVLGKLVEQDPDDEPASVLLGKIVEEKQKLIADGKIKKGKPQPKITEEDKPFEIPASWEWCTLENISIKIHYGFNASAKKRTSGVRLLRITDIQNNEVKWNNVPSCDYSDADKRNYLLRNNDIVIARTGGTIGKSFLINEINVESLFASYLIRVVPSDISSPQYIKTFLESPLFWDQVKDAAWGAGQPNISGTKLKNLKLPLPPLNEQNHIVTKVEQLMKLCDDLEQSIQQNQKYTQELLQVALKEALEPK